MYLLRVNGYFTRDSCSYNLQRCSHLNNETTNEPNIIVGFCMLSSIEKYLLQSFILYYGIYRDPLLGSRSSKKSGKYLFLHYTNSHTYSHPNLNFLQYTIQILVPHVMWSAQAVRELKIDLTQRHLSPLRGTRSTQYHIVCLQD